MDMKWCEKQSSTQNYKDRDHLCLPMILPADLALPKKNMGTDKEIKVIDVPATAKGEKVKLSRHTCLGSTSPLPLYSVGDSGRGMNIYIYLFCKSVRMREWIWGMPTSTPIPFGLSWGQIDTEILCLSWFVFFNYSWVFIHELLNNQIIKMNQWNRNFLHYSLATMPQ